MNLVFSCLIWNTTERDTHRERERERETLREMSLKGKTEILDTAVMSVYSIDNSQVGKISEHCSILIDDILYTWGGTRPDLPLVHDNPIKRKITSTIGTLHIPTGRWTNTSTTGSPPLGVMGCRCSIIDKYKIAFFGGWCGHDICYYNSLHVLNTKGFNWTELSHPPDDVMKRAWGGVITIEDDDEIKLLMIGGQGAPLTIPHEQYKYIKLSNGIVRTNEVNMFTSSTGKCISLIKIISLIRSISSGFTYTPGLMYYILIL